MVTGIPFAAVFKTEYGDTVTAKDPRKEAYQQASYIQICLRRRCSVIRQPDGSFTVQGEGIDSLTFVPGQNGGSKSAAVGGWQLSPWHLVYCLRVSDSRRSCLPGRPESG